MAKYLWDSSTMKKWRNLIIKLPCSTWVILSSCSRRKNSRMENTPCIWKLFAPIPQLSTPSTFREGTTARLSKSSRIFTSSCPLKINRQSTSTTMWWWQIKTKNLSPSMLVRSWWKETSPSTYMSVNPRTLRKNASSLMKSNLLQQQWGYSPVETKLDPKLYIEFPLAGNFSGKLTTWRVISWLFVLFETKPYLWTQMV